jgi:hypothetical protein
MPCIIKAPQLLFEFQISFFMALATHYKKSGLYHHRVSEEEKEVKKGSDYLNRGLCVRCRRSSAVEIMEISVRGEGRRFKSLYGPSSQCRRAFKEPHAADAANQCLKDVSPLTVQRHHQQLFKWSSAYS